MSANEIVSIIGSWASTITIVAAALAVIIKPIRTLVMRFFGKGDAEKKIDCLEKKIDEQLELEKTDMIIVLRHMILEIQYKYKDEETIPHFERENLVELYDAYKKKGGNHYVAQLYAELMSKPERM